MAGMERGTNAIKFDGDTVFKILERTLRDDWREFVVLVADNLDNSPFAVLVSIILSQNTNDKNSIKAYQNLRSILGRVTPERVLSTPTDKLADAIRIAGLAKQKAETIRRLASRLLEYGGEDFLRRADVGTLREFLLSIKGIGKKTVDVFLAFYRGAEVFAVDTHARRIAIRWGLASHNASYDEISSALLRFFGGRRSEKAHRLLILLGRKYCKPRNPRCRECPVGAVCPYARKPSLHRSLERSTGR
ncbi:MAG: endonuclease III [Desulfurococcales archaeon]|nr:endonuclease III [Desulfurococcales archaeon]